MNPLFAPFQSRIISTWAPVYLTCVFLGALPACDSPNHDPYLQPVEPQVVLVGDPWSVIIYGTDPDGDPLTYSLTQAPSGLTLTTTEDNDAELHWAPLASDTIPGGQVHTVSLTATDGRGGTASTTVTITVNLPGGEPVFTNPLGHAANLAQKPYVAFVVTVKDDDSAYVTLTLADAPDAPDPIDGVQLTQTSPKTATLYWKPTADQIAQSLVWTITLKADDGVFTPVTQTLTILLFHAAFDPCPGTPPLVIHAPPKDPAPGQPVPIIVQTYEAESTVDQVLVWWSVDGADPIAMPLSPTDLTSWFGVLPLPVLSPGTAAVLTYFIEVTDNDDVGIGFCAHTTRFPKMGHVSVFLPGPGTAVCPADPLEPNDDMTQAIPLSPGTTSTLRTCADADWHSVSVPANTLLLVTAVSYPSQGELIFSIHSPDGTAVTTSPTASGYPRLTYGPDSQDTTLFIHISPVESPGLYYSLTVDLVYPNCSPDTLEPNDTPASTPILSPGQYTQLNSCPGDVDLHPISLQSGQTLYADILFDHTLGDLDLWLLDPDNTPLATSTSVTSNEQILWSASTPGIYTLVVIGPGASTNTYDLFFTTTATEGVCTDDLLAPNHTQQDVMLLPSGLWSGLKLCPGHPDWFAYDLNGGENFTVQASATNALPPPVRLWFGDPPSVVAESTLVQGSATATASIPQAGRVYVEVVDSAPAPVAYQLQLVADHASGGCIDDRFEPNNSAQEAWRTEPMLLTQNTLCDNDSDWFELDVPIYATLTTWLLTKDDQAALRVELRSPQGEIVVQEITAMGEAWAETVVFESGSWHVRVNNPEQTHQTYDVWFAVQN